MPSAESLALQYILGEATEPTRAELATFERWIDRRFHRIEKMVWFTGEDVSPAEFLQTWEVQGRMLISTAHSKGLPWAESTNAKFRAVHDWDHLRTGAGFDLDGEVSAYVAAAETAPDPILWMLYSEIVLQAAACIHTGRFQPQKLVK